ncbi:uncharacterized protein LOC143906611 [Temnothorax americanus]|uniref:uncharacterized protein LOC143906611 n=1 Tax=Temnothorax americanus TaxID=1964332 RepID=UPI0040678DEA
MVRTCVVKGCNVRVGQGKQLFCFPKNPERRSVWMSRIGQTLWYPGVSSYICENHFDASQWEKVRADGSRVLRSSAIPLAIENNENISLTMHDHRYVIDVHQRHPFRDLTTQLNRLPHDHGCTSIQYEPSESIQVTESQVIAKTNNIVIEGVPYQDKNQELSFTSFHDLSVMDFPKEISHELSAPCIADHSTDDFNRLTILADICAASEPIHIPPSTASPSSIIIKELQDQLKKQEEEIKTLQHNNKRLTTIGKQITKKFHTVKSIYEKYKCRLWRLEQKNAKSLDLTSRLRADQIASLKRQSIRGRFNWSPETVKDALVFKMKWGTTNFCDFVNYLPIFPSVRTLQRTVEHIWFESGILDEVFDMLKCAVKNMSENERDCMIVADEMAIKAGLVFDPSTKKMIGNCTFPSHVGPAKKVLVIMCGGISRRWKVAVAYFFTGKEGPKIMDKKSSSGSVFKDIILKVIDKCEKIGLKVHSITTDMGCENRAMWNMFGIGCTRESDAVVSIQHPVRAEDRFYFIPDPVHLFKNILTMLESNKIIYLPYDFLVSEKLTDPVVNIQHIDDVLEFELQFEIKIAYRLKKNKVHCRNSYEKMKVGTARSVFNRRTKIALRKYAERTGKDAYRTTASFIRLVSHWFDIMSNRSSKLALGLLNKKAYEETMDHIKKTAYVFRFMIVGTDGHWKPCQTGVIMACASIIGLQDYFLCKRCYKFILTGRFCQCSIENLFSALRVKQPIPNPLQVKQNLKVLVLSQVCINAKNSSYDNDTYDEGVEDIRIDFMKFSRNIAIARCEENVIEELMESSALALPQLKDHYINILDSWELQILYDMAGS